jgi:outer membrane protein assembly factor BamB
MIAWVILPLVALSVQAKRMPPKPVAPITGGGIIYSATADGVDQYVVATDASNGKELWKVKVFHSHIKFWMEADVQFVYITNLKLMGSSLFVRDERSRCYAIDLIKRRVRKRQCGSLFSQ